MDTMFQYLKKLHEEEIHVSVIQIATIMEAAYDRDRSVLTPEQYFLMLMYNGNSLYNDQQFRRANIVYRSALQARKSLTKKRPSTAFTTNLETLVDLFPDHDVRYRIAVCLEASKSYYEAIEMLQSIPDNIRPTKGDMLLAKLFFRVGKVASAEAMYKLALQENPLNLEAIKMLLILGVTSDEINAINSETCMPIQCTEWLSAWVDANDDVVRCRFSDAIEKIETLQTTSIFAKNIDCDVFLGQCHYYNDEKEIALKYLTRAYSNNCYMVNGLSTLATLNMKKDKEVMENLEKMTMVVSPHEFTSEYWYVMAAHQYMQGKIEKATFFAHKAFSLNPLNIDAGLLKAQVFVEMKKYKEAIMLLRNLLTCASYRYEIYEKLTIAYTSANRNREAQVIATDAVRKLGKTPRTYTLVARPLLVDSEMRPKAKPFLKKALELKKHYLAAAFFLIEILREEGDYAGAVKIIKRQIENRPTSALYTMLADVYISDNDTTRALQAYMEAIHLDPNNRKAMNRLVALNDTSLETKENDDSTPAQAGDLGDLQENNCEMDDAQQPSSPPEVIPVIDVDEEESVLW